MVMNKERTILNLIWPGMKLLTKKKTKMFGTP